MGRPRLRNSSRSLFNLRLTNMIMNRESLLRNLTLRNSRRDRRLSSEPRPSRRVLTQRPSLASTHQRSECTPSMREELTPDLMMTERKCMKVDGRLSELNTLNLSGKRSMMNGARDHPRSFLSGSVRDPARRRESQRPQRVRKEKRQQLRRLMMRKRKKRRSMTKRKRRNKLTSNTLSSSITTTRLKNIPHPDWFKRHSSADVHVKFVAALRVVSDIMVLFVISQIIGFSDPFMVDGRNHATHKLAVHFYILVV